VSYIKKYYASVVSLIVFILYFITLAPSVIQIDSGELAAVEATLGIAHPTGYPLFTLIGYLFLKIPLPITTIFQANILSAIYCSIGIFFFIKSSELILLNFSYSQTQSKKGETKKQTLENIDINNVEKGLSILNISVVISAALILATSVTYWFQSTSVEVYSLHIAIITPLIYKLLIIFYSKKIKQKDWFHVSILLALGFSNHMTTVLILPALAYLFFIKEGFNLSALKKIFYILLLFFAILLLIYSYLPLRALTNPALNWGNPVNFDNLIRHITGKQYQVWIFSSIDVAKEQLKYFVENLPNEFNPIMLIISIIGLIVIIKKFKNLFAFLTLLFITTVFYSINYDIHDIEPYFLLAYLAIGFFILIGLYHLANLINSKGIKPFWATFIFAALIILQVFINFNKVDQSDVFTFEDYTKELINSTEKKSIIFSYQWDHFISESYYFQLVEKFRRDVVIIDKELLRRSWYFNQLNRNHPEIIAGMEKEITNFLSALKPFENSQKYDADLLEKYYQTIMTNLIKNNIDQHDFYIGPELFDNELRQGQLKLPKGYIAVPHLFLYKVVKENSYISAPLPTFKIKFPEHKNKYMKLIEQIVSSVLINRASYEIQHNKIERAKVYLNKVKFEFPGYNIPLQFKKYMNK